MSLTLLALLVANPQAEAQADPPFRTRMCAATAQGSVQLAYKPYGNEVFGSDGVTCRTVKAGPDEPRTDGKKAIPAPDDEPKARPR